LDSIPDLGSSFTSFSRPSPRYKLYRNLWYHRGRFNAIVEAREGGGSGAAGGGQEGKAEGRAAAVEAGEQGSQGGGGVQAPSCKAGSGSEEEGEESCRQEASSAIVPPLEASLQQEGHRDDREDGPVMEVGLSPNFAISTLPVRNLDKFARNLRGVSECMQPKRGEWVHAA
jgi:hypothetical protein